MNRLCPLVIFFFCCPFMVFWGGRFLLELQPAPLKLWIQHRIGDPLLVCPPKHSRRIFWKGNYFNPRETIDFPLMQLYITKRAKLQTNKALVNLTKGVEPTEGPSRGACFPAEQQLDCRSSIRPPWPNSQPLTRALMSSQAGCVWKNGLRRSSNSIFPLRLNPENNQEVVKGLQPLHKETWMDVFKGSWSLHKGARTSSFSQFDIAEQHAGS